MRLGGRSTLEQDVRQVVQHPHVRGVLPARGHELLARAGEVAGFPVPRRAGAEDLRPQPSGTERLLRIDAQQPVVDGRGFLVSSVLHQDGRQGAEGIGLVGHAGEHVAIVTLRLLALLA